MNRISSSPPRKPVGKHLGKSLMNWCALFVLVLSSPFVASARTIYVSPGGSNTGDGTPNNQVRTLARANSIARAGDVISLSKGTYLEKVALKKQLTLTSRNGTAFAGSCPDPRFRLEVSKLIWTCVPKPTASNPAPLGRMTLAGTIWDACGFPIPQSDAKILWSATGPGPVEFDHPDQMIGNAVFRYVGDYTLSLSVSYRGITTNFTASGYVPECRSPSRFDVEAGPAFSGVPSSKVPLLGKAVLDGVELQQDKVTSKWENTSTSVGQVFFADPALLQTTATFSKEGVYKLRLTAQPKDKTASKMSDEVSITIRKVIVDPRPFSVTAGANQTLALPTGGGSVSATLNGATLVDGKAVTSVPVTWTVPSGVTISGATSRTPKITIAKAGTYTLTMCGTYNKVTECSDVTIVVNTTPCPDLRVSAGLDQILYLDDKSGSLTSPAKICTTLSGAVIGASGASISWGKVTGPSSVSFSSSKFTSTDACFTSVGTNVIRLTASIGNCTAYDDVVVAVRYAARHFLDVYYSTGVNYCSCGGSGTIRNTHPTNPIQFQYTLIPCGGRPQPPTITMVLRPGETFTDCTYNGVVILPGAEFVYVGMSGEQGVPPPPGVSVGSEGIHLTGKADFLVAGAAGTDYWVEASNDLVVWERIGTFVGGEEPVWMTDESPSTVAQRFYRLRLR